ncbi:MAG TPA: DUF2194 domain-containing protein [Thermoflexia bacterium]|nr:DUF2194 domain-containing protein [Thermoflexia bacterium]
MKDYRISRREALLLGGSALIQSLLPLPVIDEIKENHVPRMRLAAGPGESLQRVLLLYDSADPLSQMLYPQISMALDYAKIAHDDADIGPDARVADPSSYSAVAVAAESIWRLSDEEALKIKEYVAGGGNLAVLVRAWNPVLREVFGIQDRQEPEGILIESGLRFVADFFPGLQGLALEKQYVGMFSAMAATTVDGVQVLATSGDGQYPLLWRHKFGRGRVLYWNMDLLADREFRGFAVQSVLDVHTSAVMAIANVGLFHVDDFPAPASTRKLEPVAGEYDMSVVDFYYKVWFPDMMRLARKYGLHYLWIIPFNYNGLVEPPWDFDQWVHAKIELNGQEVPFCVYMSHQVAQGEHELALHGYDHQSLRLDWWMRDGIGEEEAKQNMISALEEAKQRWQEDGLGPLPFSYVPPNNLYDAAGLEALHEAFPSVKVVGGMYMGDFEHGGSREFGPEPWNDDLFSIPRWTHGYFDEPFTRLVALSELNMFGVWTHFVHPDDIFNTKSNYPTEDEPRNPYEAPWRGDPSAPNDGMFDQLDHLLDWNQEHYPWLRWMTTQEAYTEFVNYFDTDAAFSLGDDGITISLSKHPTYLLVRLNDGRKLDLMHVTNAQIINIHAGETYTQYVLKCMGQEVRLGLLASGV